MGFHKSLLACIIYLAFALVIYLSAVKVNDRYGDYAACTDEYYRMRYYDLHRGARTFDNIKLANFTRKCPQSVLQKIDKRAREIHGQFEKFDSTKFKKIKEYNTFQVWVPNEWIPETLAKELKNIDRILLKINRFNKLNSQSKEIVEMFKNYEYGYNAHDFKNGNGIELSFEEIEAMKRVIDDGMRMRINVIPTLIYEKNRKGGYIVKVRLYNH